MQTIFEKIDSAGKVSVVNTVNAEKGMIHVSLNISKLKQERCTKVHIMNELGANHFDMYRDSNGLFLKRNAIGTWNEVFADEASFIDSYHNLAFTLKQVKRARLFRGRELVKGRLAWSGLAYRLSQGIINFAYDIRIGRFE